jgi:hypothetical protein
MLWGSVGDQLDEEMNPSTTYWRTRTPLDLQEDHSHYQGIRRSTTIVAAHQVWQSPYWAVRTQNLSANIPLWREKINPAEKRKTSLVYTLFVFTWNKANVLKYFIILLMFTSQLIDWLIIYGFTSRSKIFHLYGDVTITGWRAAKFRPMLSAQGLWAGGIFIVPHLLWHGTSVFPVSSEGPSHSVASYDPQGDVENLF